MYKWCRLSFSTAKLAISSQRRLCCLNKTRLASEPNTFSELKQFITLLQNWQALCLIDLIVRLSLQTGAWRSKSETHVLSAQFQTKTSFKSQKPPAYSFVEDLCDRRDSHCSFVTSTQTSGVGHFTASWALLPNATKARVKNASTQQYTHERKTVLAIKS